MGHADPLPIEKSYAKNIYILSWWTEDHDQILKTSIQKDHWIWHWYISEAICAKTPSDVIDEWRNQDPLCKQYSWYNVLMYFSAARAEELGYLEKIRKPKKVVCVACKKVFKEDSIPPSIVRHLGIQQIDICLSCINSYFEYGQKRRQRSEADIKKWIKNLSSELSIIPPQSILTDLSVLSNMSTKERSKLMQFGPTKPPLESIKKHFGSWLEALVEAGVLKDGYRETSRGTQCIANDGHVCLSYGEKTIDDFLSAMGIPHTKEPEYPNSNYRADFRVGDYLIEYFGLAGNKEYDQRALKKKEIAKLHNIPMIGLYPNDLLSKKKLSNKLHPAINSLKT